MTQSININLKTYDVSLIFTGSEPQISLPITEIQLLRALLNSMPDPASAKDLQGRYLLVNKALLACRGDTEDMVIGQDDRALLGAETGEKIMSKDREILASGIGQTYEQELQIDGRAGLFLVRKDILRDSNAQGIGVLTVFRDVSGARKQDYEREHALSLLEATIESTADGLLVVDSDGKIVSFNKKFAALWSIPLEIITARDDAQAIAFVLSQLKDPDSFLARIKELYATPDLESRDVLHFKDGRIFERYSKPQRIRDKSVGRIWSFRDVTSQRATEARLLAAVQLRDDFLSIASHELKTPLTAVTLTLHHLKIAASGSELLKDLTARVLQQINRIVRLVDNLLDVSKVEAGDLGIRPVNMDLLERVHRVADLFKEQIEADGCSLEISHEGPTTGIWDPLRMEDVLTNLLTNALKYGHGKPIKVRLEGNGRTVVLTMQDFGIGISEADQERIFGRFERAVSSSSFGGLGLGLYICQEIVKGHGGTLRVESEPSHGSTFILELPVY